MNEIKAYGHLGSFIWPVGGYEKAEIESFCALKFVFRSFSKKANI